MSICCSGEGKEEHRCQFVCFFSYILLPYTIILLVSLLPATFKCHCLPFLLEGVLSYNPPVRKSEFQPFDHFLIQPPPSLQHWLLLPAFSHVHVKGLVPGLWPKGAETTENLAEVACASRSRAGREAVGG